MKNLLNNLSQSEKNRILEQYNNSLLVDTSKFKKLLESKLGDVKPLLNEGGPSNNPTKAPFKNNEEANKFRQWVNQKYNQTAKNTLDLNPTGNKPDSYYNYYIQRAWNYIPGIFGYTGEGETLGQEYSNLSKTTNQTSYMDYWDELSNIGSETKTESKPTTVPFKNNTEGDEFRKWVNANYKDIAKSLDLDPIGKYPDSYNNATIQKALNQKVGNSTLGELFMMNKMKKDLGVDWMNKISTDPVSKNTYQDYVKKYKGSNWYGIDPEATKQYSKFSEAEPEDYYGTKGYQKRSIELNQNITGEFSGEGERINKEVYYIKQNNKNKGKPFLVVDPRMNIVAAYSSNYKLIDYSQTVKGRDTELLEPHTYSDWCKDSKGIQYKGNCIKPGKEAEYDRIKSVKMSELANYKGDLKKMEQIEQKYQSDLSKVKALDYNILIGTAAASPGVFVGTSPKLSQYGTPVPGIPNTISLSTLGGEELPTAIHGLAEHAVGRKEFDNELKAYLKKEKQFGNIPKEYEDLVEKMANTKRYGVSSGCFNVSNTFIQNPKVTEVLNVKPYIFVMSQEKDYYLVQMDANQGTKFFNELKGDGEFCRDPTSIATEVGGRPMDVRREMS